MAHLTVRRCYIYIREWSRSCSWGFLAHKKHCQTVYIYTVLTERDGTSLCQTAHGSESQMAHLQSDGKCDWSQMAHVTEVRWHIWLKSDGTSSVTYTHLRTRKPHEQNLDHSHTHHGICTQKLNHYTWNNPSLTNSRHLNCRTPIWRAVCCAAWLWLLPPNRVLESCQKSPRIQEKSPRIQQNSQWLSQKSPGIQQTSLESGKRALESCKRALESSKRALEPGKEPWTSAKELKNPEKKTRMEQKSPRFEQKSLRIQQKSQRMSPTSALLAVLFVLQNMHRRHLRHRHRAHCNTLQHTATHCSTLQHTATHCNTLPNAIQHMPHYLRQYLAAAHCVKLHHTATHCNTLPNAALHMPRTCRIIADSNSLQHTALNCITLQHTATHCLMQHVYTWSHTVTRCSTLQHAATYCNTLQYTATHCNTLQHMSNAIHVSRRLYRRGGVHWRHGLRCVAVCCSVLKCVAVFCILLQCVARYIDGMALGVLQRVAACCSVLQRVAVCCSVLQCVAGMYRQSHMLQRVAACCSVCCCILQQQVFMYWAIGNFVCMWRWFWDLFWEWQ